MRNSSMTRCIQNHCDIASPASNYKPTISLVIPTYNVAKYIDRCLYSCVNQSYQLIEILIVDDCGQDDSIVRAEKWCQADHRINIIRNETNLGTFHARRVGTERASGDYIIYLDPDDFLDLDACRHLQKTITDENPDIIFYGVEKNPKPIWVKRTVSPSFEFTSRSNMHRQFLLAKSVSLGTPGKAYAADIIKAAFRVLNISHKERLVFAEDALILYAALCLSNKAASVKELIYTYHINDLSITSQKDDRILKFKLSQIDTILRHMSAASKKITPANNLPTAVEIFKFFEKRLLADRYYLARHSHDSAGRAQYLNCAFQILLLRRRFVDVFRIFVYLLTFSSIKI